MADIFLGITGGIAAYKMPELTRMFQKRGHTVRACLTANAEHFVSPLAMQTITAHKVITGQFELPEKWSVEHIETARWMNVLLVCPATANIIGKFASGIADDFLSTLFMSAECPVIVCPAMNSSMFSHWAVKENLETLKNNGIKIIEPGSGFLACGEVGRGRLAPLDQIVVQTEDLTIFRQGALIGKKIIVTAGPTVEDIDPVRFISNRSSGKMGYSIAEEACKRGAEVTLVSGPVNIPPPAGVVFSQVRSASDMKSAVLNAVEEAHILIMAAAVADYRPETKHSSKIKKSGDISYKLVRTEDILSELALKPGKLFKVGFAAESDNLEKNALKKLRDKKLDLIVANDISREDIGFDSDFNEVSVYGDGFTEKLDKDSKKGIARKLLDIIEGRC